MTDPKNISESEIIEKIIEGIHVPITSTQLNLKNIPLELIKLNALNKYYTKSIKTITLNFTEDEISKISSHLKANNIKNLAQWILLKIDEQ